RQGRSFRLAYRRHGRRAAAPSGVRGRPRRSRGGGASLLYAPFEDRAVPELRSLVVRRRGLKAAAPRLAGRFGPCAWICSKVRVGERPLGEAGAALRCPTGRAMIPRFTASWLGVVMRLAWRKLVWSAGLLALFNCSGDTEPRRGQIMLALQTD